MKINKKYVGCLTYIIGFRKLLRLLSGTNETILDVLWGGVIGFRKLLRLLSGIKMEEREILGKVRCSQESMLGSKQGPE